MDSEEIKINQILQAIKLFANEANLGNIIKGKVKKFTNYRKDISQIESIQNDYYIEFTSNIEKEKYDKICDFNKKFQEYAENKKIKYRFLQYKYKLNDEFTPIHDILTIQDNTSYVIQNQNCYLCILICELNQFQPNSNIHYFKNKFLEISSLLNNKKYIQFKVIFIESFSKEPLSNKKLYKKFSSLHTFQEKLKIFVNDNYIGKILFYYVPKISSNNLLKTSFEFFVDKEKLPFLIMINPLNKIVYEGCFHNIDFNKTFENFEKNNNHTVYYKKEELKCLEKEIESFNNFSFKKIHQDLTQQEYKKIKKILSVDFKEGISNVTFDFPSSYILEMFCLEKHYNFENTLYNTTYKKALINYYFTKDLNNYYLFLKKLILDNNLSDKVLDFSTSQSKTLTINKLIEFFASFFKDKNMNFLVSIKANNYQIINTSPLHNFHDEFYKMCKLYYLMNYYFLTSPFISYFNFIPCLKLGDEFHPLKYIQKANESKDGIILDLKNSVNISIILFLSLNVFQNKSIYETKMLKIKEIFTKHLDILGKCYISVIYFNVFNDIGFTIKSKNELIQQFLSLTSPYKNIDFFFLDSSMNPLSSMQYLVYFNKINTIKSVIISLDRKIVYNDSFLNPNFLKTLDILLIKDNNTEIVLKKQLIHIEANEFKPIKEIINILSDEISLYLERTLENKECKVNYSKLRSLSCKGTNIKSIKDFYLIPRIFINVQSEKEKQTILSYFESEVYTKIDKDKILLEINVGSN